MAIYRIQKIFGIIPNTDDDYIRFRHKNPKKTIFGKYRPLGKYQEDATQEILRSGKTNGKKAKKHAILSSGLGGVGGAALGAAIGGALKGKKGATIGASLTGILGGATGYNLARALHESNLTLSKEKAQRILDNMDVADGKMSKKDFDKKWKKK